MYKFQCCLSTNGVILGKAGPLFTKQNLAKSQSCEIRVYTFPIALEFDRHLGRCAADVPVKCQSDTISITSNLAASNFTRFRGKTSYSLVKRGPYLPNFCQQQIETTFVNGWKHQFYSHQECCQEPACLLKHYKNDYIWENIWTALGCQVYLWCDWSSTASLAWINAINH